MLVVRIALRILGIDCVNTRDAQSVRRDPLAFVLRMEVAVVVRIQDVIRVLVISSFVQLMVGGNAARHRVVTNRQLVGPVYVLVMGEDAGAPRKDARSQPSHQRNFASNTGVERNAPILAAKRSLEEGRYIARRMVEVSVAN